MAIHENIDMGASSFLKLVSSIIAFVFIHVPGKILCKSGFQPFKFLTLDSK